MSLEKIANKESLTRSDVVQAAEELVDFEKQAAAADQYGRNLAHAYVEELVKEAEEEAENAEPAAPAEEPAAPAEPAPAAPAAPAEGEEKTSADKEVANAVAVLKKHGIIPAE